MKYIAGNVNVIKKTLKLFWEKNYCSFLLILYRCFFKNDILIDRNKKREKS